jgi:hypothetical protein
MILFLANFIFMNAHLKIPGKESIRVLFQQSGKAHARAGLEFRWHCFGLGMFSAWIYHG